MLVFIFVQHVEMTLLILTAFYSLRAEKLVSIFYFLDIAYVQNVKIFQ